MVAEQGQILQFVLILRKSEFGSACYSTEFAYQIDMKNRGDTEVNLISGSCYGC